jgi:AcrR family transcriptional regulator
VTVAGGPVAEAPGASEPARRPYDSPVRRQRAAETRERILDAGAELLHGVPTWDWRALTVRAVAKRAGVNERTVYRYFANERELRDAVMARFEEDAGIRLDGLHLDEVAATAEQLLTFVSSFPIEARTPRDPSITAANRRQRDALRAAVRGATDEWSPAEREVAASVLDVLWSVVSYERLVVDWGLAPKDAVHAVTWAMGVVEDAIRAGRRPGDPPAIG